MKSKKAGKRIIAIHLPAVSPIQFPGRFVFFLVFYDTIPAHHEELDQ